MCTTYQSSKNVFIYETNEWSPRDVIDFDCRWISLYMYAKEKKE